MAARGAGRSRSLVTSGSLVWLLLGLRGLAGEARRPAVGRFSQLAFVSVAVLAVTGVLRAVAEVGSVTALVSTSFGTVLLIKTALFATLMALAWRNRYLLVPQIAGPAATMRGSRLAASLRRSVKSEVALAAVVLVAAAVLSGPPPASYVHAAAAMPAPPAPITVAAATSPPPSGCG